MVFRKTSMALAIAMIATGWATADTIVVEGRLLRDVYVIEGADFYQILDPIEGTVQEVSKKRMSVRPPQLTEDPAQRDALRTQWEEARDRREKRAERQADLEADVREMRLKSVQEEQEQLTDIQRQLQRREAYRRSMAHRQRVAERNAFVREQRAALLAAQAPPEPPVQPDPFMDDGFPVPPGPRDDVPQDTADDWQRMQAEAYYWEAAADRRDGGHALLPEPGRRPRSTRS